MDERDCLPSREVIRPSGGFEGTFRLVGHYLEARVIETPANYPRKPKFELYLLLKRVK